MPLLDTYEAQQQKKKKPTTLAEYRAAETPPVPKVTGAVPPVPKPTGSVPPVTGGVRADVAEAVRTAAQKTTRGKQLARAEQRGEKTPSAAQAVQQAVQRAVQALTPQTQAPPIYIGEKGELTPQTVESGERGVSTQAYALGRVSSVPADLTAAARQAVQRAVAGLRPQAAPVAALGPTPTAVPSVAPGQSAGLGGIAGIGGQAIGGAPGVTVSPVTAEPGVGIGLGVYGGSGGSTRSVSQGLGSGIGYQPGDAEWKGKNITYPEGVGPNIGYQPGEEGWQGGRGQAEPNTSLNLNQIQKAMNAAIGEALNANLAMAQSWLSNMTATLDQLQAQIMDMYRQQGTDIDPATQAAIAQLKADMEQQLRAIDEQMNARGLSQSGYLLQEQAKALQGGWSQEERLLATRLSDIQNRMTDALMSFAQQRMNMMGQAMQNAMSSQQWAGQQYAQVPGTIAGMQQQWNQFWAEQAAQQRREAQQQYQWAQEQQFAKERFGTETQLRQRELDIQGQKAQQQQMNESLTNEILGQIPNYSSLQEALADVEQHRAVLQAQGADIDRIIAAMHQYFGTGGTMNPYHR